jgi:O-antigen/teichoic acid export membrane protein
MALGERLRFLVGDSVVYGGAAAASKALALITFPILTHHFSVVEFGLIDLFNVFAGFLAILVVFGQDSAVARLFSEQPDDQSRREMVSQSLAFQLGLAALFLLPVFFLSDLVAGRLSDAPVGRQCLLLVLAQVPFLVLLNFARNLLKWTFSRGPFMWLSLGVVAANALALVAAVTFFDIRVETVFIMSLGVQAGFGLYGIFLIRRWLIVPSHFDYLRQLIPFALPLGLICSVAAFTPALERIVIKSLFGGHDVGLYAAGAKVAMLMALVVQAFQTAWGPFSLAIHKEHNAVETYNWVLKAMATGLCTAALLLAAMAEALLNLLANKSYAGAGVVVFPIVMGLVVEALGWITEVGSNFAKRSHYSLGSFGVYLAVAGLVVYILAPFLGIAAVAYGVLAGQVAKAGVSFVLAQHAFPLKWENRGVVLLLIATTGIGIVGGQFGLTFGWGAILTNNILGCAVILAVGWRFLITADERQKIIGAFSNRRAVF